RNWDQDGASPFNRATLRNARVVLKAVSSFLHDSGIRPLPNIVPLPEGSVRFELRTGQKELFLTVLGATVEAQKWYPIDTVHSIEYGEVPAEGVRPALEWLAT